MPTEETLASYYATYYSSAPANAPKVTFAFPVRLAQHILRVANGSCNKPVVRILDFGGGDGSLSLLMAHQLLGGNPAPGEVAIDLIDYAEPNRDLLKRGIVIRRFDTLGSAAAEGGYDFVVASSIMEHVPEARSTFEQLFQATASAGRLYFRTPWIVPVFRIMRCFGLRGDFTYPAHIHDFGQPFWESLIEQLNLNAAEYRLLRSQPSPVETSFKQAPIRTLIAHAAKMPWWIFGRRYTVVGGWEAVFERVERVCGAGL